MQHTSVENVCMYFTMFPFIILGKRENKTRKYQ